MFNAFWQWISGHSAPARPKAEVRIVKEEGFPVALVYDVQVAAPSDSDVVTRRLSIRVNGQPGGVLDTPGSTCKFGGLKFNQGDEVDLHLVDIDDAGNESPPAVFSFTAKDTIAPGIPGGFGATLVAEVSETVTPAAAAKEVEAHSKLEGKEGEGTKAFPIAMPDETDEIDEIESGRQRKS